MKKAILFGNNYSGDLALRGCINDVENTEEFLKTQNFQTKLIKEVSCDQFAQECSTFTQNAKRKDQLYFHFSGHGFQVPDDNGDESDGKDEAALLGDGSGIRDDDIKSLLINPVKDKRITMFVVFDTCHSGSMCDLRYSYLNGKTSIYDKHYPATYAIIASLSGCQDTQTSADTVMKDLKTGQNESQGALTGTFLKVLSEASPSMNICLFVDKIRDELKKAGYSQYPVLQSSCGISRLTLRDFGLK